MPEYADVMPLGHRILSHEGPAPSAVSIVFFANAGSKGWCRRAAEIELAADRSLPGGDAVRIHQRRIADAARGAAEPVPRREAHGGRARLQALRADARTTGPDKRGRRASQSGRPCL